MVKWNKMLGIMLLPLLGACQSVGIWAANIPSHLNADMQVKSNVIYGAERWQKLDVYYPTPPIGEKEEIRTYPVVVFFHGGGWSSGYKEQYRFIADRLVPQGFVVVIPDYVKYPDEIYPAYQYDAAAVTDWAKGNIALYNGQPNAMHLMGHSAGAHIGAMLLVDDSFLAEYNLNTRAYRSFVGLSGPYHFTPGIEKFRKIFAGGPADYSHMKASPFVNGDEPPMLLIHGDHDIVVRQHNMERLATAIEESGGEVKTKLYPGVDHLATVGSFSRSISPFTGSDIPEEVLRWLKRHSN